MSVVIGTKVPIGFAGEEPPELWPRPRAFPRPDLLERPVDVLAGIGPAVKRKLARLGLEQIGDLLSHRPLRYVSATRISELFENGEEVAIEATVMRVSVRKPRRL